MNLYRVTHKVELWPSCGLLAQTPLVFETKAEGLKRYTSLKRQLTKTKKPYKIKLEHLVVNTDKETVVKALLVEDTDALIKESTVLRKGENDDYSNAL